MNHKKKKIVAVANLIRGGKSTIARFLAEILGTSIINFDPKRDAKFYNAIETTNVPENSTVVRKKNGLIIETDEYEIKISTKKEFLICDFGGKFDKRMIEFESDVYIIPIFDRDYESISETMRATKYILNFYPNANIIHVLNFYTCSNKKERTEFEEYFTELKIINGLKNIPLLKMPKSNLAQKIVNNKLKSNEIIGDSNFLKKGAYKNIIKFTDELINKIKEMS